LYGEELRELNWNSYLFSKSKKKYIHTLEFNSNMKNIILFTFFLGSICCASAQDYVDLAKLQQATKNASLKFKQEVSAIEYNSDFEKSTSVSFRVDTFLVEDFLLRRLEADFSTMSMADAYYQAEMEYEKLINKYYQILYTKLNAEDKLTLKSAHDKWVSFKTAEIELTEKLSNEEYSGGGTYIILGIAYDKMLLNKSRAIAYYEKLLGIVM
jgi:hypothetical protein